MTDATSEAAPLAWHWLRSRDFDLGFVLGIPAASLATVGLVLAFPQLFWAVLAVDLWILGYHHVISTYTRLCFDRRSFRESRWLIFGLLPAVGLATVAAAAIAGIWIVVSVYFYWQWFHYARQSWGISRSYRARDRGALYEDGWLDQAIFYAWPVLGILHRSAQDPDSFIGLPLRTFPVPEAAVGVAAVAATVLTGYWAARRIQAWRLGRLSAAHTLYVATHFLVFAVFYLAVEDVTCGWLGINIWHNAQYILFVWLYNTRRFSGGTDPEARLLSYISQPDRLWLYLFTCVGITGVVYAGILGTLQAVLVSSLSGTIVLYQIVNFHHYVVDGLIWKARKAPLRHAPGPN
jgi:hypothetical protein